MFIIVVSWLVEGLILNTLVIVLFNYIVSLHELPSENKVFIIINTGTVAIDSFAIEVINDFDSLWNSA